jgi:DNA-binding GntR family transcriptional regulator
MPFYPHHDPKERMNQAIYQKIKERILFLHYAPGQILNEKTLAGEFGVSRTPLRDVLSRLEADQLVRILPRTGTLVTEIEFQKMLNTYQVRFDIEALVGRLAAEQATDTLISKAKKIGAQCQSLSGRRRRRDLVAVDARYRALLFLAADNPVLTDVSERLYNLTLRLWYITLEKGDWDVEIDALATEITTTAEAWRDRDAEAAAGARRAGLEAHFERIRKQFLGLPSGDS